VGWQDALIEADVLVNVVGGYTGQRLLRWGGGEESAR
jgi:hypothetical protein